MKIVVEYFTPSWKRLKSFVVNYEDSAERHILAQQITNALCGDQCIILRQWKPKEERLGYVTNFSK